MIAGDMSIEHVRTQPVGVFRELERGGLDAGDWGKCRQYSIGCANVKPAIFEGYRHRALSHVPDTDTPINERCHSTLYQHTHGIMQRCEGAFCCVSRYRLCVGHAIRCVAAGMQREVSGQGQSLASRAGVRSGGCHMG